MNPGPRDHPLLALLTWLCRRSAVCSRLPHYAAAASRAARPCFLIGRSGQLPEAPARCAAKGTLWRPARADTDVGGARAEPEAELSLQVSQGSSALLPAHVVGVDGTRRCISAVSLTGQIQRDLPSSVEFQTSARACSRHPGHGDFHSRQDPGFKQFSAWSWKQNISNCRSN